jgi:hypothetical protein
MSNAQHYGWVQKVRTTGNWKRAKKRKGKMKSKRKRKTRWYTV